MLAALKPMLHWLGTGFKEALAMVWMTWWPLVLGFTLSGMVQSFLPRDGLRSRLGATSPATVAESSLLGVISSSCSYAASAMARALFARGASWTNSIVFMIASTNLVIELGVVLYLLLGWQFVAGQLFGGVVMIAGLALLTHLVFSERSQATLRERVLVDSPPPIRPSSEGWRERFRSRENYRLAARYTMGDLTMLRKELLAGFLIAGFVSTHVPATWWSNVFLSGHGGWTVVENAVLAPLLAVISFVCSVGNIPLAAALWANGVALGGVISFIFADLVTLPLLLIYRRFYGTKPALRLFALLWLVMSTGGLVVDRLFNLAHLIPASHHTSVMSGRFEMGWTLALNIVAAIVLITLWLLARGGGSRTLSATDPICGMTVDIAAPAAMRQRDGVDYYFCSSRCAERFDRQSVPGGMHEDAEGDQVDPVCSMRVDAHSAPNAVGPDGITYYFCSEGCRATFLAGPSNPAPTKIELGRKPSHE
jgi:YHS domain-containing protein/uncharacterized membrane protein YraQ (UPF0718 family)